MYLYTIERKKKRPTEVGPEIDAVIDQFVSRQIISCFVVLS